MAQFLDAWRVTQFKNTIEMQLQDRGGKLRSTVTYAGGYVGKSVAPILQYGETEGQEVDTILGPTPNNALPSDRRWLSPKGWDWGHAIDDFERLLVDIQPDGSITQAGINAARRYEDQLILKSMFAPAKTGENGDITVNFPATQTIDVTVGGATSLINHEKLRAGIALLNEAEVMEGEPIYMAIGPREWDSLFSFNTTTSSDFTSSGGARPINTGQLPDLYGINFVKFSEKTLRKAGFYNDATDSLDLPMWAKSGMHFGTWQDMTATVLKRDDLKGVMQPYIKQVMGATRLQEPKVVRIRSYRVA